MDLADFVAFHDCLGDPRRRPGADHNGDGVVDLSDYAAWVGCLTGPGVAPVAGCGWGDLDGDGDVDVGDFAVLVASFGVGVSAECGVFDFEPDGDVDLSDFAVFAACFTGAGSAAPANPYYFTGRRLDFDIRDDGAGPTGRPGRPLLALYDYRAREYDPWHGRFLQKDPATFPVTDAPSLARRALAIDHLRQVLTDMVRAGLTRGPWTTLRPLFESTVDPRAAYAAVFGARGSAWPAGIYAPHLDGLNLHQYARSNPNVYVDPDGWFSYADLGMSTGISGLLGAIFGGVNAMASGGSFLEGAWKGGLAGAVGGAAGYGVTAFAASASGLFATGLTKALASSMVSGGVSAGTESFLLGSTFQQIIADAIFGTIVGGVLGGGSYGYAWSRGGLSAGAPIADKIIDDVASLLGSVVGGAFSTWWTALWAYN